MNFLYRTSQHVARDQAIIPEDQLQKDVKPVPKPASTLQGRIAEHLHPEPSTGEDGDKDIDEVSNIVGAAIGTSKNQVPAGDHTDVTEDEGWITIPCKELPGNWSDASNIQQLRTLDRSFIFPGEQIHILVCLSASKQDTEVITPFRVAAVMSKNGKFHQNGKHQMENSRNILNSVHEEDKVNGTYEQTDDYSIEANGKFVSTGNEMGSEQDISATESLLRLEDHKQQTEILMERFRNSNFFVRIAQSDEPLWSKRSAAEPSSVDFEGAEGRLQANGGGSTITLSSKLINAIVDKGSFDGNTSAGVARDTVKCYSLRNGDIVVLLQVNVGVSDIKNPVLEVLQFEKYWNSDSSSDNINDSLVSNHGDPYRELLSWLLPLDRAIPPPRPLSPPLSSSVSQKSYSSSSSQIFSFGHFRSYSMPTLPPVSGPSSSAASSSSSKSALDLEDCDQYLPDKPIKNQDMGNYGLLSFRGVSLEPERFSVHCGLEGIYLPGRRWRRELEIIQPIEIHSFAAECITEELLCVQIKNVSPAHFPDIVIFLDTITIIFEEASKGGPPLSLPIASIETGNGHSLPNLALRRGEEHSFILKPVTTMNRHLKGNGNTSSAVPHSKIGAFASNMHVTSRVNEGRRISSNEDQYAVLVSCRSNYTESKLFFKQPTNWRPRIARDLMISITSDSYRQTAGPNARVPQLPVQVLTLKATNLTSEDLTLTVLAPESSTSSPSVLSLNSRPASPLSPFAGFHEHKGRLGNDKRGARMSLMPTATDTEIEISGGAKRSGSQDQRSTTSDVISSDGCGCTHLWLQSTVPLGCVPAHSSATVKLELLPLTDGIITLDTVQIAVKEKGLTYIPEQSLKINAASSIATGIL